MGAGWIHLSTYNIMNVYGLETSRLRHASAAACWSQSSFVLRHVRCFRDAFSPDEMAQTTLLSGARKVLLPITTRIVCEPDMGWWSMYPPFFAAGDHPIPEKRAFDKFSFRLLTELARNGPGNVIGFHPEGTRNKGDDPYSFLRAQPGVGKLIMDAKPQVIPVFIAGLCNSLPRQVARTGTAKKSFACTLAHDRSERLPEQTRPPAHAQRDRRHGDGKDRRARRTRQENACRYRS